MKIVDNSNSNTVTEYEYDGAKRRTVKKTYAGGVLDETLHLYYTEPSKWQVVEERVDTSGDAERQFVWGLRYVDDLVLRDRDTTGNGTLDERLYSLQDENWNVTSIADTAGTIQERYAYSAYGTPTFLNASFNSRASSQYDWENLFAGYRWDGVVEFYHVRHRVYLSLLGLWAQRDQVGLAAGVNPYQYVGSNSPNAFDPLGLVPIWVVLGALIVIVFIVMLSIAFWGTDGFTSGEAATVLADLKAIKDCAKKIGDQEIINNINEMEV